MITKEQLERSISVMSPGEIDFFLGSGASINSGIPSGGDLVWYFKRLIYCNENRVSVENIKISICLRPEICYKIILIKREHILPKMIPKNTLTIFRNAILLQYLDRDL